MGSATKSILNVGPEQRFRKIRHELMQGAGFTVVSAPSLASVEKLAKKKFHALVVGAWMTKADRDRVVDIVKERNPSASVVFYYDGKIDGTEAADAILNAHGDHQDLIRTLQHLLSKPEGKGGGGPGMRALKGIAMVLVSMGSAVLNVADTTNSLLLVVH